MKPEVAERLFIEELFSRSIEKEKIDSKELKNIDRLTGDASTRRYYRLDSEKESFVVCLDNPITDTNQKNAFVEVQAFLNNKGLRVPKVYDTLLKKGYILEEDLGDITLLQKLSGLKTIDCEYEIYKRVIDQLLCLHSLKENEIAESNLFNLKFDFEKLISEIDFTVKYFLKLFLKIEDEKYCQKIVEAFHPICKRLAEKKMVLTHRDFHSRNVMWKANDELVIIDFQDARMGIPQYDLASLLDDCYYEIHPQNKERLKNYYYENMGEKNISQTKDEFESLYQDMVLQRVFKAVGSFSYIYNTRKDERYLKYIGFAMEKLRLVMFQDQKYSELKENLYKVYYES